MPWDERSHTETVFSHCLVPHNIPAGDSKCHEELFGGRRECKIREGVLEKVFSLSAGPGTASAYEVQNESEFTQSQRDDHISSQKHRPLSQQMWCCLKLKCSHQPERHLLLYFSEMAIRYDKQPGEC